MRFFSGLLLVSGFGAFAQKHCGHWEIAPRFTRVVGLPIALYLPFARAARPASYKKILHLYCTHNNTILVTDRNRRRSRKRQEPSRLLVVATSSAQLAEETLA